MGWRQKPYNIVAHNLADIVAERDQLRNSTMTARKLYPFQLFMFLDWFDVVVTIVFQ